MSFNFEYKTLSVAQLLSDPNFFQIPSFQRPYSWDEEDAAELQDDISTIFNDERDSAKQQRPYFLGQLIFSQQRQFAPLEVIDGQQRLVTLSATLAILRDLLPPCDQKTTLQNHLSSTKLNGQKVELPRINLRPDISTNYMDWIICSNGTKKAEVNINDHCAAANRLASAILRIREDVGTPRQDYIEGLAEYILNKCFVSVVKTSSWDDAYILFRSVNARGVPLTDLDIARGEFLRSVQDDPATSVRLSYIWDDIERDLGSDKLESYLKTVTWLILPTTQPKSLKDGIKEVLQQAAISGRFQTTLKSYLESYEPLIRNELKFGDATDRIKHLVACLSGLPQIHKDWRSAAVLWLSQKPSNTQALDFFTALDGLGLGLVTLGYTRPTIERRYHKIVESIVQQNVLSEPNSPIYLTRVEKEKIRVKLSKPILPSSKFLKHFLLRINAEMLDEQIPPSFPKQITIEHVLPQRPKVCGHSV